MTQKAALFLSAALLAVTVVLGGAVVQLRQQVNDLSSSTENLASVQTRLAALESQTGAAANVAGQQDGRIKRIEDWVPKVQASFVSVQDAFKALPVASASTGSKTAWLDAYVSQQSALAALYPPPPYGGGSLRCSSVQPSGGCLQWSYVP